MAVGNTGLWSESGYVYTHDADPGGKMSFAAIARYFQEAAWHQAEALGFGYDQAGARNQFWVLVRQHMRMRRFPRWGENIRIETWPRGVSGLWAFREYSIVDGKGEVCGGATSSWMIMGLDTHRPLKPDIVAGAMPYLIDRKAIGITAGKIEHAGPWEPIDERTVRYSDMDVNGHMNNSRYVDWIRDALHLLDAKLQIKELGVNYLAESREKDAIQIAVSRLKEKVYVQGCRKGDGRTVFMAFAT